MIKFEICKGYEEANLNKPKRSTKCSAGYDFEVAEEVVIPSIWKKVRTYFDIMKGEEIKGTLVKTGIKAKMPEDMYLSLHSRSSLFNKKRLILTNGVGVIDSDYYSNEDTDGNIMFNFINLGFKDIVLSKGERVGQGIFQKYYKTDDDDAEGERTGGYGSTGE